MTDDIDNKEPGRSLARARQEKNLTLEEVAAQLHLSAHQIRLLEENDYEDLPEATYIKGYLRNYARLLNLDPITLIDAYTERANPKKNETVEFAAVNNQKLKVNDDAKAMYSIIGIVVLVIAVIAIWIGSQNYNGTTATQSTENETLTSSQTGELFGPGPDSQLQEEADTPTEGPGDSEEVPDQEVQEPAYPEAPAVSRKTEKPAVKKEAEPTIQKQSATIETKLEKSAATANLDSSEENIETADQALRVDELVLFFEQNSWADVRDANDKKLLYKTIDEGRVVTVKGIAPFKIFLGNAEGVKLSFNGKQIDFEKYKRGLIARFTVGRK
jgi:cytoskeleton protein RodZ